MKEPNMSLDELAEPHCASCRFWDEDDPERITGRCRINPPQMQGNIAPHGDAMFQTPDAAIWPETRLDDWCGSFVARSLSALGGRSQGGEE